MMRYLLIVIILSFGSMGLASEGNLKVAGFGSAKYTSSDSSRQFYTLNGNENDWTSLSTLGLNFSKRMGRNFQGIVQLIGIGSRDDYNVDVDLLHLIYSPTEKIKLIFGKQKLPTLLYSRFRETGFLYHYLDLPQNIYQIAYIRNFTGFTAKFSYDFSPRDEISVELYGGQGSGSLEYVGVMLEGLGRDILGIRLDYDSKYLKSYFNYTSLAFEGSILSSVDVSTANPAIGGLLGGGGDLPDAIRFNTKTNYNFSRLETFSLGFEFTLDSLFLNGEYNRFETLDSEPKKDLKGKYSAYFGLGYRFYETSTLYYTYVYSHQPAEQVFVSLPDDETHIIGYNHSLSADVIFKMALSTTYFSGKPSITQGGNGRTTRYYGGLDFIF